MSYSPAPKTDRKFAKVLNLCYIELDPDNKTKNHIIMLYNFVISKRQSEIPGTFYTLF